MSASPAARRLRGVYRALASGATIEAPLLPRLPPTAALPEQASLSADGLKLLKDHEVQTFCADGFLLVRPSSLSRQFHAEMVQQLDESAERGNNIMAKAPDLMRVYTDPAILGAARSLCGPGCDLHSHRHAHLTVGSPQNVGGQQTWHKVRYPCSACFELPHWSPHPAYAQDPFNDDPHVRFKHCFRWVFALYYPQDTPIELGPTGILRGCHNLMGIGSGLDNAAGTGEGHVEQSAFGITAESGFVDPKLITEKDVPDHPKQPMVCPAGSVAFIHMDSWHGAGANILEGANRYMLKFHYVRMQEPCLTGPTWDHDPSNREWTPQTPDDITPRASKATWDWLCGDAPAPPQEDQRDTSSLMAGLEGSETERVDSAIALGAPQPFSSASARCLCLCYTGVLECNLMALCLGERAATDSTVVTHLMQKLRGQGALVEEIETGWAASIPRGKQWDPESGRLQGREYRIGPQAGFNPAALRSLNPADTDVAHALSAAGDAALLDLLSALEAQSSEPWWVTCTVVSVLGSLGHVVHDAAADVQLRIAAGLTEALKHEHVWVRRNAADSVGTTIPLLQHIVGDDHVYVRPSLRSSPSSAFRACVLKSGLRLNLLVVDLVGCH
jgi:hypothetical protein